MHFFVAMKLGEYEAVRWRIKQYYLVVLLASLAVSVPHPLYPYFFAHDLHMNSTHYGALMGLAQFAHLLAALLYGLLSDRCGRRRLLIWQGALAASLYLAFALTLLICPRENTLFKILACSIYVSLAAATTTMVLGTSVVFDFCRSATNRSVQDKLAQERPKFIGHLFGVCGISTVIGPVAGQLIQLAVAGTASAFLLACSFAALGAASCFLFCHESAQRSVDDEDVETIASAEDSKGDLVKVIEESTPPWRDLNVLFFCQLLKSMSICSFTVCYALVLEAYLPPHWFYGWRTETTLALIISLTSIVRVLLQLKFFQPILQFSGGPGPTYLLGSVALSVGQCGLFWSLKYLPDWLGLTADGPVSHAQTLGFAGIHIGLMATIITSGLALIEPAITSLVGLSMNPYPQIQGLAQGINSASNLLGAAVGPFLFGWLLNMQSATSLGPEEKFIIPLVDSVFDDYQPLDPYVLKEVNEIGFADLTPKLSRTIQQEILLLDARPATTFYLAAALALVPLLFTRKILQINSQWTPPLTQLNS